MKKVILIHITFIVLSITANAQSKKTTTPKTKTVVANPAQLFYLSEIKKGGMGGKGIGSITLSNGMVLLEAGDITDLFNEDGQVNEKFI